MSYTVNTTKHFKCESYCSGSRKTSFQYQLSIIPLAVKSIKSVEDTMKMICCFYMKNLSACRVLFELLFPGLQFVRAISEKNLGLNLRVVVFVALEEKIIKFICCRSFTKAT